MLAWFVMETYLCYLATEMNRYVTDVLFFIELLQRCTCWSRWDMVAVWCVELSW